MAEKEDQQTALPQQTNPYGRVDEEVAYDSAAKELKRQKRKKCILYIIAFAVFQIGVITLFSMTIMKFRTPKFRVRSATVQQPLAISASSFNINMNLQLGVKNTNFGPFKYQNTTVDFYYRDIKVGEVFVRRSSANLRSTKKVNVPVTLSSTNITNNSELSQLASDYNSGVLTLSSQARLRGKVTILFMMKKNRSSNMNCTMEVVIQSGEVRNVMCR